MKKESGSMAAKAALAAGAAYELTKFSIKLASHSKGEIHVAEMERVIPGIESGINEISANVEAKTALGDGPLSKCKVAIETCKKEIKKYKTLEKTHLNTDVYNPAPVADGSIVRM